MCRSNTVQKGKGSSGGGAGSGGGGLGPPGEQVEPGEGHRPVVGPEPQERAATAPGGPQGGLGVEAAGDEPGGKGLRGFQGLGQAAEVALLLGARRGHLFAAGEGVREEAQARGVAGFAEARDACEKRDGGKRPLHETQAVGERPAFMEHGPGRLLGQRLQGGGEAVLEKRAGGEQEIPVPAPHGLRQERAQAIVDRGGFAHGGRNLFPARGSIQSVQEERRSARPAGSVFSTSFGPARSF